MRGTEVVGLKGRLLWVTWKNVKRENEWWLGRAGRIGETLWGVGRFEDICRQK